MDDVNPIVIGFLFIVRCLVPLIIMLGLSYLLKRLGLIRETPPLTEEEMKEIEEEEEEVLHGEA